MKNQTRYLTWLDIKNKFYQMPKTNWPNFALFVDVSWLGVSIGIDGSIDGSYESEIRDWLSSEFPLSETFLAIKLEDEGALSHRLLSIEIEIIEQGDEPKIPFIPSFARSTTILKKDDPFTIDDWNPNWPIIIAFHSFKGGVGRTLHTLATVDYLANIHKEKVLLIDADLEAPGITWMLEERHPDPSISLVDFLAMAHEEIGKNSDCTDAISITSERTLDLSVDDQRRVYILPAFRNHLQVRHAEIRPEDIIRNHNDPFIISRLFAELGKKMGVKYVVVDLRAGLSEISSGLLIDPRIFHVMVTTLNAQSLQGTELILKQIQQQVQQLRPDPSNEEQNWPSSALIFNQIPPDRAAALGLQGNYSSGVWTSLDSEFGNIVQNILSGITSDEDNSDINLGDLLATRPIITSRQDPDVQVLSKNWDTVMSQIRGSKLRDGLIQLDNWLPLATSKGENNSISNTMDINGKRKKLENYTNARIVAETTIVKELYSTSAIKNLASDFRRKVPIAVVIGAKGSGKTHTYLYTIGKRNWGQFVKDIYPQETTAHSIHIVGALQSTNISDPQILSDASIHVSKTLDLGDYASSTFVREHIEMNLIHLSTEADWRNLWIDIIAWRCGYKNKISNVGEEFIKMLSAKSVRILAIFDGLEDVFSDLTKPNTATALRALIQAVPNFLKEQSPHMLGILVFVRQDLAQNAILQNYEQFQRVYAPYQLRWDPLEALRLVAWSVQKALGEDFLHLSTSLEESQEDDLSSALQKLWGKKLGSDKSREATSHSWVIAALSDYNGLVQARDIIRFLYVASSKSQGNQWADRILTPQSIRDAVPECSKEKVKELRNENPRLEGIIDALGQLPESFRRSPFSLSEISEGLGDYTSDVNLLVQNGVIANRGGKYYVSEIFRAGLGFKLQGARPRVFGISRD